MLLRGSKRGTIRKLGARISSMRFWEKRGLLCHSRIDGKEGFGIIEEIRDRGGGRGSGNVTSKVTKYICKGEGDTRTYSIGIIQSTHLESDSLELDNTGAKEMCKMILLRPVDVWTPPQPDIFVSVIPDEILRI